jgi:hypothetical protein
MSHKCERCVRHKAAIVEARRGRMPGRALASTRAFFVGRLDRRRRGGADGLGAERLAKPKLVSVGTSGR